MSGIILNEDSTNYYMFRNDAENIPGLTELSRHYCAGQVKEVFLCVNARRASFNSHVLDSPWEGVEFHPDGKLFFLGKEITNPYFRNYIRHTKEFFDHGLDPYKILLEDTRKRGRSPWISIRANDCHNVNNPEDYLHNRFWREHPEYRRSVPQTAFHWVDSALDFRFPAVRQQLLDFTEEVLDRYDPDGVEIDWMRFAYHFTPGHEDEGRPLLTEIHRKIRKMADAAAIRRGHPVKVAVRVPAHPEDAFGLGYDPEVWVKEKLVDIVIPSPFFTSTDPSIPVTLWRRILGDEILLAPCIEIGIQTGDNHDGRVRDPIPSAMAQACTFFEQGADRLYLFNHFDREQEENTFLSEVLASAGETETAARKERRHILTFTDTRPPGAPVRGPLPLDLPTKEDTVFRISVGKAPKKKRKARVLLGLGTAEETSFQVFLNEQRLSPAEPPSVKLLSAVTMPLAFDASGLLKDRDNIIKIMNDGSSSLPLRWCEIWIGQEQQ